MCVVCNDGQNLEMWQNMNIAKCLQLYNTNMLWTNPAFKAFFGINQCGVLCSYNTGFWQFIYTDYNLGSKIVSEEI